MALPPFLKSLESNNPDFAQAIEKVVSSAMTPGALDEKTKLLIAFSLEIIFFISSSEYRELVL